MEIRRSPTKPHYLWITGLIKVQNEYLGTHLRMFLQNTPKEVHMYAYAHNLQPFSSLNVSLHEIVFHTRPPNHLHLT